MSKTPVRARAKVRSELSEALDACRATFWAIGGFSAMSNILMLTGSIFMLEVYDRVIPSRSVSTLIALLLLAGGLYAALGLLDLIRGRVMVRISNWVDEAVSERVYDAVVRLPLIIGNRSEGVQPLRDLDSIRTFLSGLGPIAFFDLPWIPFYLAICFAFHPYIGLTALVGAVVLVALTLLTELMMRRPGKDVAEYARIRNLQAEASRRNCEAIVAMGMGERLAKRWRETNQQYVTANRVASDVGGGLGALSKVMRMGLQSLLLAVGALLVVNQQATAGVIIAGSILGARALAPVDLAIANWKSFVAARQAWGRLNQLLTALPASKAPMALGAPRACWWSRTQVRHLRASRRSSCKTLPSSWRLGTGWELSDPRPPANPRSRGSWLGSGARSVAAFNSTAPRSINGRRKHWAATSAICRRTSNCWLAPSRRISLVSKRRRIRT